MSQTLDQQRAALAWSYASEGSKRPDKEYKEYRGLAKGAPALIMNSGLMSVLAFYAGKGSDQRGDISMEKPAGMLLNHLMAGLNKRLTLSPQPRDFVSFMKVLQSQTSSDYMRSTDEALELLKWIRQFVDAVPQAGDKNGAP